MDVIKDRPSAVHQFRYRLSLKKGLVGPMGNVGSIGLGLGELKVDQGPDSHRSSVWGHYSLGSGECQVHEIGCEHFLKS
jgi:hypothetical protein